MRINNNGLIIECSCVGYPYWIKITDHRETISFSHSELAVTIAALERIKRAIEGQLSDNEKGEI